MATRASLAWELENTNGPLPKLYWLTRK